MTRLALAPSLQLQPWEWTQGPEPSSVPSLHLMLEQSWDFLSHPPPMCNMSPALLTPCPVVCWSPLPSPPWDSPWEAVSQTQWEAQR